jgi:glutamyl-tRNA reductase
VIEKVGVDSSLGLEEREKAVSLVENQRVGNYVYLQTCNRVELYKGDGQADYDLTKHLFRVVSGLNSSMVGESHILGQVKRAYKKSVEDKHISPGLHRLFQSALRTGKRARSQTDISKGAVSYSHASCTKLREFGVTTAKKSILIIGVNSLTTSIIKFLNAKESCKITICNRSSEKVKPLIDEYGCDQLLWENLKDVSKFDGVVSATGSDVFIVTDEFYPKFTSMQLIIDLAVPRDFSPEISSVSGVTLLNLEDIERGVNESLHKRTDSIKDVEAIIDEELAEYQNSFLKWEKS